jgi:hypothetical protein
MTARRSSIFSDSSAEVTYASVSVSRATMAARARATSLFSPSSAMSDGYTRIDRSPRVSDTSSSGTSAATAGPPTAASNRGGMVRAAGAGVRSRSMPASRVARWRSATTRS